MSEEEVAIHEEWIPKVTIVENSTEDSGLVVEKVDEPVVKKIINNMSNPNTWAMYSQSYAKLQSKIPDQVPKHDFAYTVKTLAEHMMELSRARSATGDLSTKNLSVKQKKVLVSKTGGSVQYEIKPDNDNTYYSIIGIDASMISNESKLQFAISTSSKKEIENQMIRPKLCGNIELAGDLKNPELENQLVSAIIPSNVFSAAKVPIFETCESSLRAITQTIALYCKDLTYVDLHKFIRDVDVLDRDDVAAGVAYKNLFVGIKARSGLHLLVSALKDVIENSLGYQVKLSGKEAKQYPIAIPMWLYACIYHAAQLYHRVSTLSFDKEQPLSVHITPIGPQVDKQATISLELDILYISYPKKTH